MSLDNVVLRCRGGFDNNSLCHLLNDPECEDDESNQLQVISHSSYYKDNLLSFLQSKKDTFSIYSSNIDSINSKFSEITSFIDSLHNIDFEFSALCFQECRIGDDYDMSLIQIPGYTCITQGKICSNKGGLIIYLHEKFSYRNKTFYEKSDLWEAQFIEVYGEQLEKDIILGNIYRPPRDSKENCQTFKQEIARTLNYFNRSNHEVILAGDFNVNLLDLQKTIAYNEFFDTMTQHSFFPKITLPTRLTNTSGTLIDNFYCKLSTATLNSSSGVSLHKLSDHLPYFICLDLIKKCKPVSKYIKICKKKKTAANDMLNDLIASDITSKLNSSIDADPNMNYAIMDHAVNTNYNKHYPYKLVKFNKKKHKINKWMTNGLLKSINNKNQMYLDKLLADVGSPEFYIAKRNLDTYNAILKRSIREAKLNYYERSFQTAIHDIKRTWQILSDILNRTVKKKAFPEYFIDDGQKITDKIEIANRFNSFFTSIGPKLARKINSPANMNFTRYLTNRHLHIFKFNSIDETDIGKAIDILKSKNSSGFDNISCKLLKILKPALIKPLTMIINQSLHTGIFPDALKIAKVLPLYKKNDASSFNNYRPISLLPSISKVFEKIMFKQIYNYFQTYKLFYSSQYGFREGHSTELAAIELIESVIKELDNDNIQISIFLDLSKAFDTLDHTILLKKLSYYGIIGNSANLIQSYLTNRQQFVEFDGVQSTYLPVTTGVPQGSILGPLLFIIYINDLSNATNMFRILMYADDTTLSTTLNTTEDTNNITNINNALKEIDLWLKLNKLSLNIDKSQYMIFHSKQKRYEKPKIMIEETEIEQVETFNFLGLTIDQHLTWKPHTSKISSKISRAMGIINKLKHFLPLHVKKILYSSLVLPHLNYNLILWGHHSERIFKLQKRIVRVTTVSKYNAHTDPLFKQLGFLKLADMYELSKYKFYYKLCNNKLPLFSQSLELVRVSDTHNYFTRRNADYIVPRVRHVFASSSLSHCIPKLINNAPNLITTKVYTHSMQGFSNYIKKLFLKNYQEECLIQNCYVCQNSQQGI